MLDKEARLIPIDETTLTINEWLRLALYDDSREEVFDFRFPTEGHRDEYLDTISERPEAEVRSLLRRFLMVSGGLGIDELHLQQFQRAPATLQQKMLEVQHIRLLVASAEEESE